ncbi:YncE family protein [Sphaerimonospora thailandensis]|uniref:YVTN family beta-propeller protein n=1 Tax=Sphaerimonospora thailandensis TaxID=795644 RepID=A0A8J3W381_9ACTN|nr:beta-propeller fold lactonase family protein [Sphaerimonospora thailandensis]GIH73561.1 hypothetical protein Mth01_58140 [Sphaerimonospora thailandensis]
MINTRTNRVIATVAVGTTPDAVAVTPDSEFVYVANFGSNNVTVIDADNNTFVTNIPVGAAPVGVAVAAMRNGPFVYVTNNLANNVSAINANTVIATIPVGALPTDVAVAFISREEQGGAAAAGVDGVVENSMGRAGAPSAARLLAHHHSGVATHRHKAHKTYHAKRPAVTKVAGPGR